jgi:hypothetical protein
MVGLGIQGSKITKIDFGQGQARNLDQNHETN